jgi:hypothetical protein
LLTRDIFGQQIKVQAGHEMYVTTDSQYAENCDDKYMYMDYVSTVLSNAFDRMLIDSAFDLSGQLGQGYHPWQAHLR